MLIELEENTERLDLSTYELSKERLKKCARRRRTWRPRARPNYPANLPGQGGGVHFAAHLCAVLR
jgi:hypothetical protein